MRTSGGVLSAHMTKTSVWKNKPGNSDLNTPGATRYSQINQFVFLFECQMCRVPHADAPLWGRVDKIIIKVTKLYVVNVFKV